MISFGDHVWRQRIVLVRVVVASQLQFYYLAFVHQTMLHRIRIVLVTANLVSSVNFQVAEQVSAVSNPIVEMPLSFTRQHLHPLSALLMLLLWPGWPMNM